MVERRDLVSQ